MRKSKARNINEEKKSPPAPIPGLRSSALTLTGHAMPRASQSTVHSHPMASRENSPRQQLVNLPPTHGQNRASGSKGNRGQAELCGCHSGRLPAQALRREPPRERDGPLRLFPPRSCDGQAPPALRPSTPRRPRRASPLHSGGSLCSALAKPSSASSDGPL